MTCAALLPRASEDLDPGPAVLVSCFTGTAAAGPVVPQDLLPFEGSFQVAVHERYDRGRAPVVLVSDLVSSGARPKISSSRSKFPGLLRSFSWKP